MYTSYKEKKRRQSLSTQELTVTSRKDVNNKKNMFQLVSKIASIKSWQPKSTNTDTTQTMANNNRTITKRSSISSSALSDNRKNISQAVLKGDIQSTLLPHCPRMVKIFIASSSFNGLIT
jgi:hypothetical protein